MSVARLLARRAKWVSTLNRRRRAYAKAKPGQRDHLHAQIDEAKRAIRQIDADLKKARRSSKPRIITARQLGLTFQYVFGGKGRVFNIAGHYTAGHRASGAAELMREARNDHAFHRSKGWGGLSYEWMIADDGTIVCGNPTNRKSAAVALHNTGLVNICMPGTTGDKPTEAQARSLTWLLANAHTSAMPAAHRSPVDLRLIWLRGHRQFPDQSTACPGNFQTVYTTRGTSR